MNNDIETYKIINTNEVKEYSDYISEKLEDLSDEVLSFKGILSEFGNVWKGKDYDDFNTKSAEFLKNLYGALSYIESLNDYVSSYRKGIDKIDDNYSYSSLPYNLK